MGTILTQSANHVNKTNHETEHRKILVHKDPQIQIFDHGVIAHAGITTQIDLANLSSGRKVSAANFSRDSRRRLRAFVVSHDIPDSSIYGLTFTLPKSDLLTLQDSSFVGPPSPFVCLGNGGRPSDFAETLHRFGIYFRRAFPRSGLVYRVELQTRGFPHIHCIAYIAHEDFDGRVDFPESRNYKAMVRLMNRDFRYQCIDLWLRAVEQTCFAGTPADLQAWRKSLAKHNGFDCQPCYNHQGLLRYILDDTSKHKREQLGYVGQSWAVVARRNFVECPVVTTKDQESINIAARILGKIRRYKVQDAKAPFGWKHSKYHPADRGCTVLNPATVACLHAYIKSRKEGRGVGGSHEQADFACLSSAGIDKDTNTGLALTHAGRTGASASAPRATRAETATLICSRIKEQQDQTEVNNTSSRRHLTADVFSVNMEAT